MDSPNVNITPSPAPGPTPTTVSTPERAPRRQVDLGREEARVPWAEWFHRASQGMDVFTREGSMPAHPRAFRVTLRDGRPYAVFSVKAHIARGKCHVDGAQRWCEATDTMLQDGSGAEVCDVITGYSLVGTAYDGRPVVLTVPPDEIASVECVLVQGVAPDGEEAEPAEDIPFGFAAFSGRTSEPELTEVEEPTRFSSVI